MSKRARAERKLKKEKRNPRLAFLAMPHTTFHQDCPCPKVKCVLHGWCEPCTAYHESKGQKPFCLRK
jgi:hypothetical protein